MIRKLAVKRFWCAWGLLLGCAISSFGDFVVEGLQYAEIEECPGEVSVGLDYTVLPHGITMSEVPPCFSFVVPDSVTNPDTGSKYIVTTVRKNGFNLCYEWIWTYEHLDIYPTYELTKVTVPSTVVRVEEEGLNQIDTLVLNTPKFIKLGNRCFENCHLQAFDLTSLPENIDSIGTAVLKYNELEKVEWPEFLSEIPGDMFSRNNIYSVNFPATLKTIGPYAFWGNELIKSLNVPAEVVIDEKAFLYIDNLRELTLGENCTIYSGAFNGCDNLKRIVLPSGTKLVRGREDYGATSQIFRGPAIERIDIAGDVVFESDGIELAGVWTFNTPFPYTEVYYHTSVPQYVNSDDLFGSEIYNYGKLYVEGDEGVENAKNTFPWNKFRTILPIPGTGTNGINDVESDSGTERPTEIYSLGGVRISCGLYELNPGCYIIREGGHTRKIVVK
ncbi:MAG: leucine-rich repeat domain-containing protein [Muribaculaceae bacterium]|nr:leucine-rich repeat domain-containing protein [Muribaculaceae bacterium]